MSASPQPDQFTMACGDTKFVSSTKKEFKLVPLLLGKWNVWTLLNNPCADCPERRIALVAKE